MRASSARARLEPGQTARKDGGAASGTRAAKIRPGRKGRASTVSRAPYKGAVVFNSGTGQIVFSHNPGVRVPPASLTKILSMFVAEDAIKARKINPNVLVTVSPRAAATGGSRMGLGAYDKVPLRELLHGMAVSSGNDASIAVAEYIGGSEKKFVRLMNRKARALGMSRSTFMNANGLPAPGQYTTARDMLVLSRAYLAAYPGNLSRHHKHIFNSYKGNMTSNANSLLSAFHGADGLKTGYVSAAGYNIIATAQRGGQRVIGVVLGAPSSAVRASEAGSLLEACFSAPASLVARSTQADLRAAGRKASVKSKANNKNTLRTAKSGSPQPKARAGGEKRKTGGSDPVSRKMQALSREAEKKYR